MARALADEKQLREALERERARNEQLQAQNDELRSANEALRRSQARHRAIFDALVEGVVFLNPSGEVEEANDAVQRRHGHTLEELADAERDPRGRIIRTDGTRFPVDEQPAIVALRSGEAVRDVEMGVPLADGSIRWRLVNAQPVYDDNGNLLGAVASFFDITDRKRAEEEREQLRKEANDRTAELQAVLDAAPVAIWIAHDTQAQRITGNAFADQIVMQVPRGENISKTAPAGDEAVSYRVFRDGVELKPEELPAQVAVATGKAVEGQVVELVFPDGRQIDMVLGAVPLRDLEGGVRGAVVAGADVTPLKKSEVERERLLAQLQTEQDRLRASEEQLRLVVESSPDHIFQQDRDLRYTFFSKPAAPYTVEEVLGKTDFDFYPEEEAQRLAEIKRRVLETGAGERTELKLTLNETEYVYEAAYEPRRDRNGRVVGVFGYARDISGRKRIDEQLRQSETKYRNLFENMTEEVHFWRLVRDEEGQIKTWRLVDANPPTLKTWGKTLDEIEGKTTDEIFGPGATDHYMPVVRKIVSEGIPHSFEDYFPNLDKYFRFTSVPLGDYFITTGADITGIKQAYEAARESEERFRATFEQAAVGITHVGLDGSFIRVNQKFCEIVGQGHEALAQLSFQDITYPADLDLDLEQANRLKAGEISTYAMEKRYVRADGSLVWVNFTGSIVRDPSGEPRLFIAVVEDISARKAAEEQIHAKSEELRAANEELLQATRKAERAVRVRDEFLAVAAHELKTPVTGLLGFAQTLQRELERHQAVEPERQQRALVVIGQQAQKIARIVGQLLDVASLDAGELALECRHTDLVPVVENVVRAAQDNTNRHSISLDAPAYVKAFVDPTRIEQAITILVDNAIRYSPDGGPITIALVEAGEQVEISVRDYGIGIAAEHSAHLFERYSQAHSEEYRSGLGLGLYIVGQIVAAHSGRIRAAAPQDGGTRFEIVLGRRGTYGTGERLKPRLRRV